MVLEWGCVFLGKNIYQKIFYLSKYRLANSVVEVTIFLYSLRKIKCIYYYQYFWSIKRFEILISLETIIIIIIYIVVSIKKFTGSSKWLIIDFASIDRRLTSLIRINIRRSFHIFHGILLWLVWKIRWTYIGFSLVVFRNILLINSLLRRGRRTKIIVIFMLHLYSINRWSTHCKV